MLATSMMKNIVLCMTCIATCWMIPKHVLKPLSCHVTTETLIASQTEDVTSFKTCFLNYCLQVMVTVLNIIKYKGHST